MQFAFFETALRAQKSYSRLMEPVCKKWNLTHNELDVLLFLANNPGLDTARDICTYRHMKPSIVSFHVDNLVREGYLERQEMPGDRRKCRLVCTQRAQPVIDRGRAAQESFSRRLTEGLTEAELDVFFRCFTVLGENMTRLTEHKAR